MRSLLLVALLAICANAEETGAFLKVGVGARALSLGGAYTAAADDASGLYWNPASVSALPKRELSVSHAELGTGIRQDWVGFAAPGRLTIAVSAGRLGHESLEGRDDSGRQTGSFTAADTVVTLGLAAKGPAGLRLGGALKAIESRIAETAARTVAADLGVQAAFGSIGPGAPILGVSVLNAGPGLRFADRREPLPLTFAAGAAYRLPPGLTLTFDVRHRPNAARTDFSAGTEYAMFGAFAVRAGYASGSSAARAAGSSTLDGFAAGLGFRGKSYSLDYAMSPFGELGTTQRFSLGARF